jgi:MOB kinase activator 1
MGTPTTRLVYTWVDANHKHVKLPAATYIDFVFTWIQNLLEDQTIFPTKAGLPFPPGFPATCESEFIPASVLVATPRSIF